MYLLLDMLNLPLLASLGTSVTFLECLLSQQNSWEGLYVLVYNSSFILLNLLYAGLCPNFSTATVFVKITSDYHILTSQSHFLVFILLDSPSIDTYDCVLEVIATVDTSFLMSLAGSF